MSDLPALVFDLDGTLIGSSAGIAAAVNRALVAEGIAPQSQAAIQSHVGRGLPALVAGLLRMLALPPTLAPALTRAIEDDYTAHPGGAELLYPGVLNALGALADQRHALALCTNKPAAATRAVLAATGLAPFFPHVVTGDSLPVRKPDPAPLLTAVRATGRSHALYVGDSAVDAETAAGAALPFLLFTGGYPNGDPARWPIVGRFSEFAALPGLISAHLAKQRD